VSRLYFKKISDKVGVILSFKRDAFLFNDGFCQLSFIRFYHFLTILTDHMLFFDFDE